MDVYKERIQPLFDRARKGGKADADMEREIGLPKHSINKWKNGQQSWKNYLAKIAAYFNVSVDYLTGATNEKTPASAEADGLTEKEWELIRAFRAAPAGYQASALALLESAPPVPQVPGVGESGG